MVDLPGAALLPGFVNAHTHLELTSVRLPPAPFLDWLPGMMQARRTLSAEDYASAAAEGIRLLSADGTTSVGDFGSTEDVVEALGIAGFRGLVLREFTGSTDPAEVEAFPWRPSPPGLRRGLAPHAPYSVPEGRLRAVGRQSGIPLAVHASELEEEVRLLESGAGPLADFLDRNGFPRPPAGLRPVPYLASCGVLRPGALAVHANYLDAADIACLAASGASVAYCPGSHAFFGHRDHPLPRLLEAGINVALGTDSLASNDALSMRREMRKASEVFPGIPLERILAMATLGGARALGLAHEAGSLEIGKAADLVAVQATSLEEVVRREPKVLGVWRGAS